MFSSTSKPRYASHASYCAYTWLTEAPNQSNVSDALEETLGRLSKKPGVKATIVLDRVSGSILKTSGQVALIRKANNTSMTSSGTQTVGSGSFSNNNETAVPGSSLDQGVEELAAMVWNFVSSAGDLVQELDTEVSVDAPPLTHRR